MKNYHSLKKHGINPNTPTFFRESSKTKVDLAREMIITPLDRIVATQSKTC